MIQLVALALYQWIAAARRRWYARRPDRRRRLGRPVVSIGALSFGGSGKTPVAELVARLLIEAGERPAILSRGYGRRDPADGVVVVRDAYGVCADLPRAGDEPLMLARKLPGAVVVVSPDRYLAGLLAETHLGCTVHVLDDGFQHVALARDVDILVVGRADYEPNGRPRLRESRRAARLADAAVVAAEGGDDVAEAARRLDVPRAFHLRRELGPPRRINDGADVELAPGAFAIGVAGIADPDRFFADLRQRGASLQATLRHADHHQYTRRDVREMSRVTYESASEIILTTEKDMVRLLPLRPIRAPIAWLPIVARVEPADEFREWLLGRVREAGRGSGADLQGRRADLLPSEEALADYLRLSGGGRLRPAWRPS